jgi:hypothetical protein
VAPGSGLRVLSASSRNHAKGTSATLSNRAQLLAQPDVAWIGVATELVWLRARERQLEHVELIGKWPKTESASRDYGLPALHSHQWDRLNQSSHLGGKSLTLDSRLNLTIRES